MTNLICSRRYLISLIVVTSATSTFGQEITDYRDAENQLDLLRRRDIVAELAVTPQQQEQIRVGLLQEQALRKERARSASLQADGQLQRECWVAQAQFQRRILNPDQLERLDQLRLQYQALGNLGPTLAEAVELTDGQISLLAAKEEELGKELRQKMLEFHRRVHAQLQRSLTAQQRAEWSVLVGAEFTFESPWPGLSFLISLR